MKIKRITALVLTIGLIMLNSTAVLADTGNFATLWHNMIERMKKQQTEAEEKIKIKVLILPKFELGDMTGDYPGEAQFYYERYMVGAKSY